MPRRWKMPGIRVSTRHLQDAAKEGAIEYVFSEGVSGTDYPRAMREYAEQGGKLIIGESYAVEKEARQVAADYPDTAFVMGSSGRGTATISASSAPGTMTAPISPACLLAR